LIEEIEPIWADMAAEYTKKADDIAQTTDQLVSEIDKIEAAFKKGFESTGPVDGQIKKQEELAKATKSAGDAAKTAGDTQKITARETGEALANLALIQSDGQKAGNEKLKESLQVGVGLVKEAVLKKVEALAIEGAAGQASGILSLVPPPAGPILAMLAASAAFTLFEGIVAGMNKGGIVPGSGNTDTVPALLTPGELVIPKDLTSQILSVAGRPGSGRMNQGGLVQGGGGFVININEGHFMPRSPAELDRFVRDRLVPSLGRLRRQGAFA
jgi:hypothetical protein